MSLENWSIMSVEIVCGKCGEKISAMKMLKSVKDVLKHYNNKCPSFLPSYQDVLGKLVTSAQLKLFVTKTP